MSDLSNYEKKRNLQQSKEPKATKRASSSKFVIQKHDASHLHYDFLIAVDGVYKSWAIPKGPSISTKHKRLAVQVEDHPLSYGNFEGVIPKGEYGAGTVMVWDRGTYRNLKKETSMKQCLKNGRIEIFLNGKILKGGFALVRFREKNWLLIKMKDDYASDSKNLLTSNPKSVKSGKTMSQIQKEKS